MRRFIFVTLVLVLIIALAGALAGNLLLYDSYRRKEIQLDVHATQVTGLESRLGAAESGRSAAEGRAGTLEEENRALQAQLATRESEVATLQAEAARPPIPTPTPPTRPTIFLTSPADGAQFQERDVVVIRWNAINQDRIGRVTLLVDGRAVAETVIDAAPTAEGEFQWTAVGPGAHQLAVVAANTVGSEGEPATVTIEVLQAPEPESSIDESNAAILDAVEEVVSGLRRLEPIWPVERTLYSAADLQAYIVGQLEADYPLEEAQGDAVEMAAFDFMPADIDLSALYEALYTEQIAGFYDADAGFLAVITGDEELGPLDKAIYAHEFVHALQDQHYGLMALDPEGNSGDASLAVTALIEGDAMLVQEQFMLGYMESDELFELLFTLEDAESTVLDSAPAVVREQLLFTYEAGLSFVKQITESGGHQALNVAFDAPPQSTEQILHPEKYLAGESPELVTLPPLTETLGAGWSWVGEDVLGEYTLRLYLEQQLDPPGAASASAGWGGDRYAVYQGAESGSIALVMRIVWDTDGEAAEFVDAYNTFGGARFGIQPETTATSACWEGDDAICLYRAGRETLLVRAPDLALVRQVASAFPDLIP